MSTRIGNRSGMTLAIGLTVVVSMGQAPKSLPPSPPLPTVSKKIEIDRSLYKPTPDEAAIKPLPLETIPDDPPPHEGAMIDLTYRLQAPDLVIIEVLEALPGRPISGEHLIRPDGKVSLGFYGDVHIAGLTTVQAKIIHHLHAILNDHARGTYMFIQDGKVDPLAPPGTVITVLDLLTNSPFDEMRPMQPGQPLLERNPFERDPGEGGRPEAKPLSAALEIPRAQIKPPPTRPDASGHWLAIAPEDSERVIVDVASYNSAVYYVLGDVATIGRLPFTGNETVLDAIQFMGGLQSSADPKKLVLNRPERGGKPSRAYKIDLDAIHRGDKKANLQFFPGDRLIVGRKDEYLKPVPATPPK